MSALDRGLGLVTRRRLPLVKRRFFSAVCEDWLGPLRAFFPARLERRHVASTRLWSGDVWVFQLAGFPVP